MPLDTAEKQKLIDSHQIHPTDTGSVEIQIAMLSERITKLSDHLQKNNLRKINLKKRLLKQKTHFKK